MIINILTEYNLQFSALFIDETALYAAAASGRLPICQVLLRYGAKVLNENTSEDESHSTMTKEHSPLYIAIVEGNYSIVELFLNHLIGPPPAGNSRNTSAEFSCPDNIINGPCDKLGRSPLSVAAAEGEVGVIELLISRNADIEFQNESDGLCPLIWAIIGIINSNAMAL